MDITLLDIIYFSFALFFLYISIKINDYTWKSLYGNVKNSKQINYFIITKMVVFRVTR
jgi:hypothetical protein